MILRQFPKKIAPGLQDRLLVTCVNRDNSAQGCGLFLVDLKENRLEKLIEASCTGIDRTQEGYLLAADSEGIFALDHAFQIVERYDIKDLFLHGLKVDLDRGLVYVIETAHNKIGIYQLHPFVRIDEIVISEHEKDFNHINDLLIHGDKLIVSMLSLEQGFRNRTRECDGAIVEYDLNTKKPERILSRGLNMPHSIIHLGEEMLYCESMQMSVVKQNQLLAGFQGFTRGLAFNGRHFYVGQSRMRHVERASAPSRNISQDSGFYVWDQFNHTSTFINLPPANIYQIYIEANRYPDSLPSSLEIRKKESDDYISLLEWHDAEKMHRWMAAPQASFHLKKQPGMEWLRIEALSGPTLRAAEVRVNGAPMGQMLFAGYEMKTFSFDAVPVKDGVAEITIEVPELWSPAEVYGREDIRQLGLGLANIGFE